MNYNLWKQFIICQTVPAEFVIANLPNSKDVLQPKRDLDFMNFVMNFKSSMRKLHDLSQPIGLLAGAGTDSTFLLALLIDCGFRDIHCVSLRQDENSSALEKFDETCSNNNIKHRIFERNELNHKLHYDEFYNRW